IYKKDNFYIISIEIVFFSLIQELYVPDSLLCHYSINSYCEPYFIINSFSLIFLPSKPLYRWRSSLCALSVW
ncbi:hypothetical protein, partial [Staphylococcus petrasii]